METLNKIGLMAGLLALLALYGLRDEADGVASMDMGRGAPALQQAAR